MVRHGGSPSSPVTVHPDIELPRVHATQVPTTEVSSGSLGGAESGTIDRRESARRGGEPPKQFCGGGVEARTSSTSRDRLRLVRPSSADFHAPLPPLKFEMLGVV